MGFKSGPDNPRWRGGVTLTKEGYRRITSGILRGEYEHRAVWMLHFGAIPPDMDVHHKDENRTHNDIGNLELRESQEHRKEKLDEFNEKRSQMAAD